MADNKKPQNNAKRLQNQTRSEFLLRPLQGVRQDRSAPLRERAGSTQPYTLRKGSVYTPLGKNSDRVQNSATTGPSVIITARIAKPISEEIDHFVKESGITRSHMVAILLNEAVHQKLHMRHATMLSPLVRKAVAKGLQGILPLLIATAYDVHQTRSISGIALAKAVRPEEMEDIRERTAKLAKKAVLHKRAHIDELYEVAQKWLADLDPDENQAN